MPSRYVQAHSGRRGRALRAALVLVQRVLRVEDRRVSHAAREVDRRTGRPPAFLPSFFPRDWPPPGRRRCGRELRPTMAPRRHRTRVLERSCIKHKQSRSGASAFRLQRWREPTKLSSAIELLVMANMRHSAKGIAWRRVVQTVASSPPDDRSIGNRSSIVALCEVLNVSHGVPAAERPCQDGSSPHDEPQERVLVTFTRFSVYSCR